MTAWPELLAVLTSFVGAAFAIIRFSLAQNRAMTERFVGFLEESIRRQESVNAGFRNAIERLTNSLRENSQILLRLDERLQGGA